MLTILSICSTFLRYVLIGKLLLEKSAFCSPLTNLLQCSSGKNTPHLLFYNIKKH